MASILDRYGIKEVADVTFYALNANGKPANPVLYLDTLKVSTIEQTAETTEARGGKGNPPLIVWDYGKEINVTLEDALFSAKSMAIMFGNGSVGAAATATAGDTGVSGKVAIMKTETFVASAAVTTVTAAAATAAGWNSKYQLPNGEFVEKKNAKFFDETGATATSLSANAKYFCTYDLAAEPADVKVIEISPSSFPGTYYVTGDTYARSEASGEDEFFQFIIPKAKVLSENTITLEAEGDPSVFNMNLRVLRPADGAMMQLVKYSLDGTPGTGADVTLIHNHNLNA